MKRLTKLYRAWLFRRKLKAYKHWIDKHIFNYRERDTHILYDHYSEIYGWILERLYPTEK